MVNLQKVSRLTLIKRVTSGLNARGLYKCTCGNTKEIRISSVSNKSIISCGCYSLERKISHGLSRHPLYKGWIGIKDRCYNINCHIYYNYGAKGVRMCDEWLNDFLSFYNWAMANGWRKGLHIDKDIIPKKLKVPAILYSPDMCSIVSNKQNNQSRHNNRLIEYDGRIESRQYWADLYGINHCTLRDRISSGMSLDDAFKKPVRKRTMKS